MRGADLLIDILSRAGATTMFSLSGNHIMPVYDAALDKGLRIVHTRHEAAAVFMAEGAAQMSGTPGVALVTAGPGFANALGALFSTRHSETPVLLLSGDSPIGQDGCGAFQECDQAAAAAPFVKKTRRCHSPEDLAADVAALLRTAVSGRPGPVHLTVPEEVLKGKVTEAGSLGPEAFLKVLCPLAREAGRAVAGMLAAAQRPLILTGPSLNVTRAGDLLRRLADGAAAPVVPMESPRGLNDPALGAFADVLREADLVVYLGKPIDYTTRFGAPEAVGSAPVAVIDPEEAMLARAGRLLEGRLVLAALADAAAAAEDIIARLDSKAWNRHGWCRAVKQALDARPFAQPSATGITPADICAAINRAAGTYNAVVVIDGGEFGQWAQALIRGRHRIINGTAGAIGGALAQAIGAKIARPDAPVLAISGDGAAGFHFMEFDTAVRAGVPIVVIIGNDARWNAEYCIQLRDYGVARARGCELNPAARYDQAAAALGGHGEYVSEQAQLGPALARAIASGKPACVNVRMTGLPAPVFARTATVQMAH